MKKIFKPISFVLLIAFTSLSLRVDVWAEVIQDSKGQNTKEKITPARQFQSILIDTEKLLEEIEEGKEITTNLNQIKENKITLNNLANQLREEFNQTRANLISKNLPDEIIKRHDEFVEKFEEKLTILLNNLDEIEKTKGEKTEKIKKTKEFLKLNLPKPKHTPIGQPTHRLKQLKTAPRQSAKLPSSNSLFTKLSNFLVSTAEAGEIEITQEIMDLANSLGNQPVPIYQFVRNNIKYEPYYGSLKGAVGCLHDKAGNDFDQASLLISLLKAPNIQARYVYGQVEIPIERAKKWIGIDDPWKVADVLVTYGIPAITIVKGGQVSAIRIEHCWVEAFVDYVPSGGAVHKKGDTWIPLDPSFKLQNIYEGEDISNKVFFDVNTYLSKIQKGDALAYYINQIEEYIKVNNA